MTRVFLIAGEASGDRLGGALMQGLREIEPEIAFEGVGGDWMQGEGLVSLYPMEELSVMGLAEVLPKYRQLKRRLEQTVEAVIAARPDVLVTIDAPDFCLRVAGRVRERMGEAAPRVCHYVAPSVWAWRAGRAEKMAKVVDQVLTLLPFEPPYMEAAGMRADFVGHPVVTDPVATDGEVAAFRLRAGLDDRPLLLVLPGSRQGEVRRLMPVFGAALQAVVAAKPELRLVLPTTVHVARAVAEAAGLWPAAVRERLVILDPTDMPHAEAAARKRAAFRAADGALAASGTVSLELAAVATPMVIAYRLNWLTWQIVSRMMRIDSATLVNLVTKSHVVPEYLGPKCQPGPIGQAVLEVLTDPATRAAQLAAMDETMELLGRDGAPPGRRAAEAVLAGLREGR